VSDGSRSRSDRVLDPAYVADVDSLGFDDLHRRHAECVELETEVSYIRRLAQAKIDIVNAELDRRARGGTVDDLIRALPQILADQGPRADPVDSHLPLQMAPSEESEWAPELAKSEQVLANLPNETEEHLRRVATELAALERDVSAERHALHTVLERLDASLAERRRQEVS